MSLLEYPDQEDSELVAIAREFIVLLKDAKEHPALIGSLLLTAGLGIREYGQGIDFVVWDFSGTHVPPQTTQPPAKPPDPTLPPWALAFTNYAAKFLGLSQMVLPGANVAEGILSGTPLDPNAALASVGSPVPNIFGLLGIKFPTQISLSEVLIIAGLIYLFDPLLKAVSGAAGELLKGVTSALPALG